MTNKVRRSLGAIIWLGAAAFCGAVLTLAGAFLYLDPQTPRAESYRQVKLETPLRIYTADGDLMAEFGERRVIPIGLENVPQAFIDALLDTEDKRFYEHSGIDFISLTNDTFGLVQSLLFEGSLGPGASTITMQLARNVSFSLERKFIRKFKEMLLALKIEQELTKDEILELYINVVPFGKRAYGAEAAARTYYGKPLAELSLAQLAMLAGIPQAPSAANPINGPERALRRRNLVLGRMLEQGSISREDYDVAAGSPISARIYQREVAVPAPFAAEWVRQQLIYAYPDLYSGGYEVDTTISSRLQLAANDALRKELDAYDRRHGYRGPEARIELEEAATEAAEQKEGEEEEESDNNPTNDEGATLELLAGEADDAALERIRETLRNLPDYGGRAAAAVLAVEEESAQLLTLADGEIELTMPGVEWARPYIDESRRGRAPKTMPEVLSVGDVVRVEAGEEGWVLAQTPAIQGALVSLNPENGQVFALTGGYDFRLSQYNNAMQAARQPGSGFKPIVYAAALANGVTPASIYMDAPLVFDDENLETEYRPDNDNNAYNGPTRLREALYRSINLVSMRVLLDVEAGPVVDYAQNFNLDTSTFPRNTQLAVGGGTMAISPLAMANAYAVFANGGYLVDPHIVTGMRNLEGEELLTVRHPVVCRECEIEAELERLRLEALSENGDEPLLEEVEPADAPIEEDLELLEEMPIPEEPLPAPRAIDERVAYIMHTMLQEVIRRGTGSRAMRELQRRDLAGKTGTTNDAADTWFNGYTPDIATSVWVGFSDYSPLGRREYGSTTPLTIWIDYMREALDGLPERFPAQPDGIVTMKIDPETGKPTVPSDPRGIFEFFLREHAPSMPQPTASGRRPDDEVQAVDLF